jgi:hypothetical protein
MNLFWKLDIAALAPARFLRQTLQVGSQRSTIKPLRRLLSLPCKSVCRFGPVEVLEQAQARPGVSIDVEQPDFGPALHTLAGGLRMIGKRDFPCAYEEEAPSQVLPRTDVAAHAGLAGSVA